MDMELLKRCNRFFADFDFLLMLFHYCVLMFLAFTVLKMLVPPELSQTNLTFYMTLISLMLVMANLRRNAFPAGYLPSRLTDETKVQVLFAVKTFVIVWCVLVYSEGAVEQFFGMNIQAHHELFVRKCN